MTRREFMRGVAGAALVFAAPALVTDPGNPEEIVWARTWVPRETFEAMRTPASVRRMLDFERKGLEVDASEQYGRLIQFEIIDEDGQRFRRDPGDDYYVLWRERLDLHPYWSTRLGE